MRDLKKKMKRVDELCRTDTFFLCLEQSARHFEPMKAALLRLALESARHSTGSASSICEQTIYTEFLDETMSYSFSGKAQVRKDA